MTDAVWGYDRFAARKERFSSVVPTDLDALEGAGDPPPAGSSPRLKKIGYAPASHLTLATSSLSAPSFPKGIRKRKVGHSDSIRSKGFACDHDGGGAAGSPDALPVAAGVGEDNVVVPASATAPEHLLTSMV
jgi:hypothetical protein